MCFYPTSVSIPLHVRIKFQLNNFLTGSNLWFGRRTTLEKILFLLLVVCIIVIVAIAAALNAYQRRLSPSPSTDNSSSSSSSFPPNLCLTPDCVSFANSLLSSVDSSVDPCDDFFEYACGGWIRNNPIPTGHPTWGTFAVLHERNQVVVVWEISNFPLGAFMVLSI